MNALIILFGLAAAATLWIRLWRWVYRPRQDRPVRLSVPTADGWTLGLWHRPAARRRFAEPVLLVHGLANCGSIFELEAPWSLARFLSEQGFDCYTVDLRGAGASRAPDEDFADVTVDDHVERDAPALVDFVCHHAGAQRVLWVGHSLGGLVGLAAAGGPLAGRVAALATLGSPVFFPPRHSLVWLVRLGLFLAPAGRFPMRWLAELGTPLGGLAHLPLAHGPANLDNLAPRTQRLALANAFAPVWRGVLGQLLDWVRHDAFRSLDARVDYRARVRALSLPVLVLGGVSDALAPELASRAYFELLTTPDKQLTLFGRRFGQQEDYGHGDLVLGKNAEREVYPVLGGWLERRATPREPPSPAAGAPLEG